MQVLCDLQVFFLIYNCQTPGKAPQKGSFTIRITADDGTNKAIRTINIKVK